MLLHHSWPRSAASVCAVALPGMLLANWAIAGDPWAFTRDAIVAGAGAFVLGNSLAHRLTRVSVTPEGVKGRDKYLRRVSLAWSELDRITRRSFLFSPYVDLYAKDGRHVRAPGCGWEGIQIPEMPEALREDQH